MDVDNIGHTRSGLEDLDKYSTLSIFSEVLEIATVSNEIGLTGLVVMASLLQTPHSCGHGAGKVAGSIPASTTSCSVFLFF